MSFSELFSVKHNCSQVEVETTNQCNAKCIHCPSTRRLDSALFMSPDTFKKVIEVYNRYYSEAEERKPKFLFAGGGEPLLNKNLESYINLCTQNGYPSEIITNGQLLTRKRVEGLVKSGLNQINVSVHAITKEDYKAALDLDFDITLNNVLGVRDYLRDNNITETKLLIISNELSVVKSTSEEIQRFWEEKQIDFAGSKPIWNRAGNLKDFDKVLLDENHHTLPNFELPAWCLVPKYQDTIGTNGDFLKCGCDFFGPAEIYGNVCSDELTEVYQRYENVLENGKQLDSCINCVKANTETFFSEFSGFVNK